MSYLDDPRVFLATERTLLAWIRTELSILAMAFLLKKVGVEYTLGNQDNLAISILVICGITILLSILAVIQSVISMSKLGKIEIPGPLAKPLVVIVGVISVLICISASYIVMMV